MDQFHQLVVPQDSDVTILTPSFVSGIVGGAITCDFCRVIVLVRTLAIPALRAPSEELCYDLPLPHIFTSLSFIHGSFKYLGIITIH